ncbi:hypothetical protein BKA61DRAFT_605304 [Leptodontidium sp. MPI-SDFR-AT-0119]|nr:hypothetical protein BKA61DRAFT_605304 [Leptodontidium sp. MPI-SDFR-AT-0119]
MPAFLPDKLHGKHPWNNWLDNSAQSAAGWVAIQQKIPKVGEKLMRKIVLLYEVVQEQFDEVCCIGEAIKLHSRVDC